MKNNVFGHQFDELLKSGQGNNGRSWTNVAFAKASKIGADAIGDIRNRGQIPKQNTYDKIVSALFPKKNTMDYVDTKARLHNAWLEARDNVNSRKASVARIDVENYSLRDIWKQVLRVKTKEFSVPVSGASKSTSISFGGFANDELKLVYTEKQFFVPVTEALSNLINSRQIDYDVNHCGMDFDDSPLSKCALLIDQFDIQSVIEKYRKIYSDIVIAEFASTKTHKPYNKKKLGVWNISSHMPAGRDETSALTIELYETDFFTNWIMSQVFEEMRQKAPHWLDEMEEYPTLEINKRQFHLPHLTPSISLNCFVISKPKIGLPKTCFTRLKSGSSNYIQHHKLHLPVNEGLNHEDIPEGKSEVDVTRWWQRMIAEELGADLNFDKFSFEALNVFIDHTVGEFGILGILTTEYSIAELNSYRNSSARDRGREFVDDLIEVAATEFDLITWVLDQPQSVNSFVSYTPNLIDILVNSKALQRIYISP